MGARLLITGFEPFRTFTVNPSWHAAEAVARGRSDVRAERLPVDHRRARERLLEAIARHRPLDVLCMGLAAGDLFRLELLARKPAELADLAGPPVLHGRWPWRGAEAALRALGEPVRTSTDAGRYVCESTYWSLLHHAPSAGVRRAAFLHVPALSGRFDQERISRAVVAMVGIDDGRTSDHWRGRL